MERVAREEGDPQDEKFRLGVVEAWKAAGSMPWEKSLEIPWNVREEGGRGNCDFRELLGKWAVVTVNSGLLFEIGRAHV